MIRLAILDDSAVWPEVAKRLRGSAMEWGSQISIDAVPPVSCNAVACLAPARCDARWIERCLAAKKHVLADAQPWLSVNEVETLMAVAQTSAVQLAIVNPDRFLPSRMLIRQQLEAGKLGELGLVRLHRWVPANNREELTAAAQPVALIRDLDLVFSLLGHSPNSVYAVERVLEQHERGPGRLLQVHLGFSNGAMALIDYANHLPAGDGYTSLSVIGSLGAAYADDHHNMQLVYRGGSPEAICVQEGSRQLVAILQDFVDGLAANRDLVASLKMWRRVLASAELVRQSLTTRQACEAKGR